jgi:hypothetical protein
MITNHINASHLKITVTLLIIFPSFVDKIPHYFTLPLMINLPLRCIISLNLISVSDTSFSLSLRIEPKSSPKPVGKFFFLDIPIPLPIPVKSTTHTNSIQKSKIDRSFKIISTITNIIIFIHTLWFLFGLRSSGHDVVIDVKIYIDWGVAALLVCLPVSSTMRRISSIIEKRLLLTVVLSLLYIFDF